MRKYILSILLASSAVTPALAQDRDHGRWRQEDAQSDRAQAREERSRAREERANSGTDATRETQQVQVQPQQQQPRFEGRSQQWQGGNVIVSERGQANQQWQDHRLEGRSNEQAEQQRREWDRNDRGTWNHGDLRQGDRPTPNVMRDRNPVIANDPRWQAQPTERSRWTGSGQQQWNGSQYAGTWNRDWRNSQRYDWRRYRDSHRSIFRIGIYYDPFGYGYRPFDIGYRLYPAYYGQQYWIDPALYRLPYPPPGTMWVRYWDDALLVDMYTGQVIDVVHNFFW